MIDPTFQRGHDMQETSVTSQEPHARLRTHPIQVYISENRMN